MKRLLALETLPHVTSHMLIMEKIFPWGQQCRSYFFPPQAWAIVW